MAVATRRRPAEWRPSGRTRTWSVEGRRKNTETMSGQRLVVERRVHASARRVSSSRTGSAGARTPRLSTRVGAHATTASRASAAHASMYSAEMCFYMTGDSVKIVARVDLWSLVVKPLRASIYRDKMGLLGDKIQQQGSLVTLTLFMRRI